MTDQTEQIARLLAEVERIKKGDAYPHWEDLPQDAKDELTAFVADILAGKPVQQQHEAWFADQLSKGWAYGATFNAQAKQDPDLVHWEEYPEERRAELLSASRFVLAVAGLA